MKRKDELAIDRILECAKAEFTEKGFAEASMRSIAEKAGYTTGMLYGRFADKSRLFREIVQPGADELLHFFIQVQEEFAAFPAERQKKEMHAYSREKMRTFVDIIYAHFDAFKLIVCKSAGSGFEFYIDRLIEIETASTERFVRTLVSGGFPMANVRADLSHMLTSAMFNGIFEVVAHEFPKEDALVYIGQLQDFFDAGWDRIMEFQ